MMRKLNVVSTLLLTGCLLSSPLYAEEQAAVAIEPAAMQALDQMGEHLRSLQSFSLQSNMTLDDVLDLNGQKIQLTSTTTLQVRKPNGLRADIEKEGIPRQIYYDGKTFTLYGPETGYYASAPAAPSIGQVLANIQSKYGIEFPLVDLFHWGQDPDSVKAIKQALVIGPSKINGQMSNHYAFRQEGIDWQIWIAQGDEPLPLRYVITTLAEPSQPQYSVTLSWDTAAKPEDSVFTFVPGDTDTRIEIVNQNPAQSAQ
jgi:hypothetical protein